LHIHSGNFSIKYFSRPLSFIFCVESQIVSRSLSSKKVSYFKIKKNRRIQRERRLTFILKDDNKVAIRLNTKIENTAKAVRTKLATAIQSVNGTADQCGEQKAAGIDAMVYIYRLKCLSSPPIPSAISLSISSVLSSPVPLSTQLSTFLPGLVIEGTRKANRPFRLISRS